MSQSYPYMAIAQQFQVDYSTVLRIAKMFEQGYGCTNYNEELRRAIREAVHTERNRRAEVAGTITASAAIQSDHIVRY